MVQCLVKRLIGLLCVVLCVTFIASILGLLAPGDLLYGMPGFHFTPQAYHALTPGPGSGLMIANDSQYSAVHLWEVVVPCVTLALIVLAFSFIGAGLRDAFDPRSKD